MDLKARAKKLKTDIPAIFLALKDKETPLIAKIFAGITIAYALSPVDLAIDNRDSSKGVVVIKFSHGCFMALLL